MVASCHRLARAPTPKAPLWSAVAAAAGQRSLAGGQPEGAPAALKQCQAVLPQSGPASADEDTPLRDQPQSLEESRLQPPNGL